MDKKNIFDTLMINIDDVVNSANDQGALTNALVNLQDNIKEAQTIYNESLDTISKIEKDNQSLRDTNQKLFLRVSGTDIINNTQDEPEKRTFEKLFKGE